MGKDPPDEVMKQCPKCGDDIWAPPDKIDAAMATHDYMKHGPGS